MKKKNSFWKLLSFLLLALTFSSLTACSKKEKSLLEGKWQDSNGTEITFFPDKAQAIVEKDGVKTNYKYMTRRDYKFKVYVNRLMQFGMDMGNDYAGEELTFGTMHMNADGSLFYKMSEGTFTLFGGKGTTVEDLDGLWSTKEETGPFAKLTLDLSKATGEYKLTGYFDQDELLGEDGIVLEMTGSYRTEAFLSMIFYDEEKGPDSSQGIEFQQLNGKIILLDQERFLKK